MSERILKWLYDIRDAINEIEGYFEDFPRDFNTYQREEPDFPITSAKRIDRRTEKSNHAYDNISDENIWAIISKHIPLLKKEVLNLINE